MKKQEYLLFYRRPVDRFLQLMGFGFIAYWGDKPYLDIFDFNLIMPKEERGNIKEDINQIISKLENSALKIKHSNNLEQTENYLDKLIKHFADDVWGCHYCFNDQKGLLDHLANNEAIPGFFREALKL